MNSSLFKSYLKLAALILLMAAALVKVDVILTFLGKAMGVLSPLFIGIALAFIINGPYEWIKKQLMRVIKSDRAEKLVRIASVLLAHLVFLLALTGMFYYIIPQFIDSVRQFSSNYPTYREQIDSFLNMINSYLKLGTLDLSSFDNFIKQLPEKLSTILTGFLPQVFTITTSVIGTVVDIVLGFVLSIYILADKRNIERMLIRANRAYLSKSSARIEDVAAITTATFKKFIYGQLTEALILGVLCFIGMMIFGFPYALPISIMIGVSNLVPIAGPIIGTIPSALILLLIDPVKALWFILFIVILQQIEGNIIYPRVVGQSIGLPPLWLLLVIIVGGGLFGVLGMVLGVPIVTVAYQLLVRDLDKKLEVKAV